MRLLPAFLAVAIGCICQQHEVQAASVRQSAMTSPRSLQNQQNRRLQFDPNNQNEDQSRYLAMQRSLTDGSIIDEWEWVLLRVNGVEGLENADWIGEADPVISAQAKGDNLVEPPGIEFDGGNILSKYIWEGLDDTNKAEWYEIGMVAYDKGTATSVDIVLKDKDPLGTEEVLLEQTIDLATTLPESLYDQWVDVELNDGDYTLNVSLQRSLTPILTEEDHEKMGLTETLFDLDDGSVASLVYKTDPAFNFAVLYFPGRSDSFAHPHILDMYEKLGYDFYSLDPRYCGRTRRFMNDTLYGHWIDDFDKYKEEIDMTMEFMKNNKEYSKAITHVHSTGALVALNYAMQVMEDGGEDPFDAYILNGPFLDWGHVGGQFYEFILENAGVADFFGMENPSEGGGIGVWHTRTWLLHRYNVTERPLISAHLNAEWAQAATTVQQKITDADKAITKNPVLLIASLGDDVILASESVDRMPYVANSYTTAILKNNAHDVTFSSTRELNELALAEISEWLATGDTTGTFENTTSSAIRYSLSTILVASLAMVLLRY